MNDIVTVQRVHDGEFTLFTNGDYIFIDGDPEDHTADSTYYRFNHGPPHLQILAEDILRQKRLLRDASIFDFLDSHSVRFENGRIVESRLVDTSPRPSIDERGLDENNETSVAPSRTAAELDVRRTRQRLFDEFGQLIEPHDVRNPLNAITFFLGPFSALKSARAGSQLRRVGRIGDVAQASTPARRFLDAASTIPDLTQSQEVIRSSMVVRHINHIGGEVSRHANFWHSNPNIARRMLNRLMDLRSSVGANARSFSGSNVAVAAVEIGGGNAGSTIMIFHSANLSGIHSEAWIIGLVQQLRIELRSTDIKLLSVLTERSPCSSCALRLRQAARQIGDPALHYLVTYQPSRNAPQLVTAYGL